MEEFKEEEIKNLLEKNLEVSEANHELLKKMARAGRWGLIFTGLKWVIIISVTLGAYYYFEPLWNKTMDLYNSVVQATSAAESGKTDQTNSKLNLIRLGF